MVAPGYLNWRCPSRVRASKTQRLEGRQMNGAASFGFDSGFCNYPFIQSRQNTLLSNYLSAAADKFS